jgi:large conductance mechanosensitive channel
LPKDNDLLEEVKKIRELLEPAPPPPVAPPKNFVEEFKDFLKKYKVMGLAVAFIMGVYLGALVKAFVSDLVMPIINIFLPEGVAWDTFTVFDVFLVGHFMGELLTFIIVAVVIFVLIKYTARLGIE